jgi:hypothetical protein
LLTFDKTVSSWPPSVLKTKMVIRVFSVAGSFYKREDGAGLTRFLKNLLALDF